MELREQLESILNQNDCYTEVRVSNPDGSSYITTAHAEMIDEVLAALSEIVERIIGEDEKIMSPSGSDLASVEAYVKLYQPPSIRNKFRFTQRQALKEYIGGTRDERQ